MRVLAAFAAAVATCSVTLFTPTVTVAQDFVGFDRSSFGRVVLNRNQSAGASADDMQLELSVGTYNNESIRNYSPDSIFARIGHSVGRLDILTDAGIFPCTAFIVDEKHVLTNYHCVPGILNNPQAKATRIDAVQFVAGYTQQGVEEGTKTFIVSPTPVEAHEDLDFAVLEVLGNPSREFGKLALSDRTPQDGDPYWVIGHPMGEAQRISREQCKANAPALSGHQLLHTCDTLPGNSGSPIIDASLQMVVALHHAGSKKDSVNFGIPMRDILGRSKVLMAALNDGAGRGTRTDATPIAAPTDEDIARAACDSMYAEAKAYGQCFGYSAYVQQCPAHAFAPFARAFIDDQCQTAAVTPAPVPVPVPVPVQPTPTLLRPWCGSAGLNSTEAAICNDAYLAGLDAELERSYGQQSGRSTVAQQRIWLTGTRNACGANSACIGQVIVDRIAYLKSPAPAPSAPEAGDRLVSGNYTLPSSQCYIVTASRAQVSEAKAFANQWFAGRNGVRIFKSDNGFHAVVLETVARDNTDWRLSQLKNQGAVPGDSYCSSGNRFIAEVMWNSAGGSGSSSGPSSGRVMYVDNNADGTLNVRTGPGTSNPYFTEIDAGTEVRVLGNSGNWSNIRLPNGRDGWVYTPLLTAQRPYVQQCSGRVVNIGPRSSYNARTGAGFLAVRDAPSSKTGRKISEVYQGDSVRVLARKDGWARLQCISGACLSPFAGTGGAIGWSSEKYLSISCR